MLLAHLQVPQAYIAITVAAFGLVATWLAFLVWAWRTGQFKDNEQAKYRVFEDEPVPGVQRETRV